MSGSIVILTGAGISAESGLGTFRDVGGLWDKYDLEEVATPQGFAKNPSLVHEFYNERRRNCLDAEPNAAHAAIAELQQQRDVTLVTQNIDDLHERGGSQSVIHMHGELMRALCSICEHHWDAAPRMFPHDLCPDCGAAATRPDIVWFGEMPYHMDKIHEAIEKADLFVAIGTSGQVYPAAGFVAKARAQGAHCVELNLEPSDVASGFHEVIEGPASKVVPIWVEKLLSG